MANRDELLTHFQSSLASFEAAVADVTPEDLGKRLAPGEWSVEQIIHHVADTEVIAGGRLRLLLARDGVPIVWYGEQELTDAADQHRRSVAAAIALVEVLHRATLELLHAVTPTAWAHSGEHEKSGAYSVETWVTHRIEHITQHSAQMERARRVTVTATQIPKALF